MELRTLAVEGPIGVGKTSLACLLAERLSARTVLESTDNPFLDDFYRDVPGTAFKAQLFFLLNRHAQQREMRQPDLFRSVTVSDYLFAKDRIFAYLNLPDAELQLYERLYRVLSEDLPRPDLVIYLQARDEVLLERIARRGRPFEKRISREYVAELNKAYNYFFFHYDETPLLVVNTSEIDFVGNGADLDDLTRRLGTVEKGTQYYVPLGSR